MRTNAFTLIFEDGYRETTNHTSYEEVSELYLNELVRTSQGLKRCVRVIHPIFFSIIDTLEEIGLVDDFARELVFYLPESDTKDYLKEKEIDSNSILKNI